ncbi:hypothetical protein [Kibdelosporangium philippinense]|uniref:hypothetical protein n=1 Tax=Kibdelosporangium philippinense TaxID=211113 RepID=UPI00361B283A
MRKTVVISGGTDGMGRATALERIARGDRVIVIGSNPGKAVEGAQFLQADLSSVKEVVRVAGEITGRSTPWRCSPTGRKPNAWRRRKDWNTRSRCTT